MKDLKGRIHSIESFGTVDGPGIRFIIFLQGCCLRCTFCHNRDTWDINAGVEYSIEELVTQAEKYKSYMKNSNGGVTVTGGEPLIQVDFVYELFQELKKREISTCLDTSGALPIDEKIEKLLSVTDLVLLDIKHINEEKSKDLTGISNKNFLDFARYLSNHHIPVWIRHVLIPTITDDKEDLKKLKDFIDTLNNVEKIDVIPYHTMGAFKWKQLGYAYPLENIPAATLEDVKKAKEIMGFQ